MVRISIDAFRRECAEGGEEFGVVVGSAGFGSFVGVGIVAGASVGGGFVSGEIFEGLKDKAVDFGAMCVKFIFDEEVQVQCGHVGSSPYSRFLHLFCIFCGCSRGVFLLC